ncbi:MAG: DUF1834 family protein [Methylophaga sp.]|nr:DUF1834 family protein [Methylophaga sp.]
MIIKTTQALVDLVKANFPAGIIKTVDTLPGRLDDAMLKRFLLVQPAIYFAFIGGRGNGQSHDVRLDVNWVAYVITGMNDSAHVPGPDDIINVLAPLIHGHTITDVGTLFCTRIDNLFSIGKDKSGARVHALTFSMPNFSFDYSPDYGALNDFITYHAEHSMTAGDDEPLAIDELTLPQ